MELAPAVTWIAFAVFALVAIGGALGMATTMGMFRSGIFLMASFVGVAGLFILLSADLLALLQVMMYLGGMLVMILFMVLFSHDPGGAMMTGMMDLQGPERLFSAGLERGQEHEVDGDDRHDGGGEMDMDEMSMFTPAKKLAMILSAGVGTLLFVLLLLRPHFRELPWIPSGRSPEIVGNLLMSKYMIAFEGAGLLILLGIFGAVMISRPGRFPDARDRSDLRAAVDEDPAPIAAEPLDQLVPPGPEEAPR